MQKLAASVAALFAFLLMAVPATAKPDRVVLGYSAVWRDSYSPPDCYNYDAITHLARAFLVPHPDGKIEVPDAYFDQTMESLARKHHVKLLISIGGEASNADNWLSIARNPQYLQRFCDDLSALLSQHDYDGFDIDWEPSALTTEDGDSYVDFLQSLRLRFPKAIITTALGTSEYWVGHFSWQKVAASVDYVNVMAYDYSGGWGGRAAYCSSLFPAGAYIPKPDLSDAEGMTNLIVNHKVPPAKLLMGMTFWPSRFAVNHIGDQFPVNGPGYSMNITYAQAMYLLNTGKYADFWDDKAAMPYLERMTAGSVVCYESPRSIARKCKYAAKLGCGGVMIWHLGADLMGNTAPLMDAVAKSCGAEKQAIPRSTVELQIHQLVADIQSLKPGTPGDIDGTSDEQLSHASSSKLQDLVLRLGTNWAMTQDKIWKMIDPKPIHPSTQPPR